MQNMENLRHQKRIQHLLVRAGFGTPLSQLDHFYSRDIDEVVDILFRNSKESKTLLLREVEEDETAYGNIGKKKTKQQRKEDREKIKDLNVQWFQQMVSSEAQLREKMTLFWHDHFATRSQKPLFVQLQNNTLRKFALGKFGDLLTAVAKDPAMLHFLNNQQNKKQSPNENFARELLELFTLGIGNYTEQDIKEAARGFTGWASDQKGNFIFNRKAHDNDAKTFMGKTGNFDGDDIIRIILSNPKSAYFITRKIYKYFVNPAVDEKIVRHLSEEFYRSDYDISFMLQKIFTSDWFYDEQNIGAKIKSPIELIATLSRTLDIKFEEGQSVIYLQKLLGQVLFYPPGVNGWPENTEWIDSSSLTIRTQLASILLKDEPLNVNAKEDGDVNTEHLSKNSKSKINAKADLTALKDLNKHDQEQLVEVLTNQLIQVPINDHLIRYLIKEIKKENEGRLRHALVKILSLPEYQLC
jgi:uncharacterized protein (DUF1800 family)